MVPHKYKVKIFEVFNENNGNASYNNCDDNAVIPDEAANIEYPKKKKMC